MKLAVRVHPGARRNRVRGWLADGSLKLEVTAPPEAGRANRAVCELVARALGLKRQQVSVTRGETSRSKQIEIEGMESETLEPLLDAWIEEQEQRGE